MDDDADHDGIDHIAGERGGPPKRRRGEEKPPVISTFTSAQERAIWCNEYILKNADEVWAGDITPGHTLASLVAALAPKSGMRASEPA